MTYKMGRVLFLILLISSIISCSGEYGNEKVINDIENNNSDRLIKNYYQRYKLEKDDFKKVVELYSEYLAAKKLKRIEYKDEFSFKRRDRNGYIYLDDNNNFVASITFKYVILPDSSYEINYIDFRNSTNELPCVKFPSKFPVKCVALPNPALPNVDSLLKIYPVMIGGHEIYHSHLISRDRFDARGDTLRKVISFNTGNLIIGKNIENILGDIDELLGASEYTFSEVKKIGEPIVNISYDPSVHSTRHVQTLSRIIRENTGAKTKLNKHKTFRTSWGLTEPVISIGYALSEARVKF